MNWYYVEAGQQAGPVTEAQFEELRRGGRITEETLVWREGMANWVPCREARSAAPPTGTEPSFTPTGREAVCVECGRMFNADDMIRHGDAYICANCKPVFMQKLSVGASLQTGALNYAGFWIRFAAKMVDGLILGLPFMVTFFYLAFRHARSATPGEFDPTMLLVQLGFIVIQMIYQIFFVGKYGATPGKMVCKLRIVTGEGDTVGYGRATGRFFAEMLSGMICYIGYLMVAFDGQKRALHDHICNTRVVVR